MVSAAIRRVIAVPWRTVQHASGLRESSERAADARADDSRIARNLMLAVASVFVAKVVLVLLMAPLLRRDLGSYWLMGSADNYDSIAKNILLGNGYRFTPDTAPTLLREPGYPFFLAGLRAISEPHHLTAAILANVVLASLCALLLSRLSRSISPLPAVRLIAPILFLINPGVVIAELRSGVEISFTLLLLCFFLAVRRAFATQSVSAYLTAGIVLGLTCLVRSTPLLFPGFLLGYRASTARSWRAAARETLRIGVLTAAGLAVISPWAIRNFLLVGRLIPTASVTGVAMYTGYYTCTHADSGKAAHVLDAEAAAERNALAARRGYRFKPAYYQFFYDARDEVAFNNSLARYVLEQYAHSPATFVRCAANNAFRFWFGGKRFEATIGDVCVQLPYLALALIGLTFGCRRADRPLLHSLLLFVGYLMAVSAPIHGQGRFSVPLVPIVAVLAAIPIARLIRRELPGVAQRVPAQAALSPVLVQPAVELSEPEPVD